MPDDTPAAPLDLAACRADIERAHTEVGDIAHDGAHRRWRMSIPARPERDSDLIIAAGLARGESLADEVEQLRAEQGALKAAIYHLAAEAHRRKWVHEDTNLAAFGELHRIGNDLRTALDTPESPASGRTDVPRHTEATGGTTEAQGAAESEPTTEQIWNYLQRNPQHFRALINRDIRTRPDWWRAHFAKEARIAGAVRPHGGAW